MLLLLPSSGSRRQLSARVEGSSSPCVPIAGESSRPHNLRSTVANSELGISSRHRTRRSKTASSNGVTRLWSGWQEAYSRQRISAACSGGEAVNTVVYILNMMTTKGTSGKTPYELWNGSTPAVHHLRTFGCVAHVKNTGPHMKKLNHRSRPMIFVGYEPGSKAYRVYDPMTRRVHISRDVVFDEEARWEWGTDPTTINDGEFRIEYTTVAHPEVVTTLQPQLQEDVARSSTSTPSPLETSALTITFASPPSGAKEDLDQSTTMMLPSDSAPSITS